ncbi:MAG TPA: choice-of-anchor D domain-containing protein, partial [Acidobacteriaceae bacterium]
APGDATEPLYAKYEDVFQPTEDGTCFTDVVPKQLPDSAAEILPINISPANATLVQTQQLSLFSNYSDLASFTKNDDLRLNWCVETSPQTCGPSRPGAFDGSPTLTLQGALAGPPLDFYSTGDGTAHDDASKTFITNDSFITAPFVSLVGTNYICVNDADEPTNFACTTANFYNLSLALNPPAAFVQLDGNQKFTASVDFPEAVGAMTVAWDAWALEPLNLGNPTTSAPVTSADGRHIEQMLTLDAVATSGSVTATAKVTVPQGKEVTLTKSAVLSASQSATTSQSITLTTIASQLVGATVSITGSASSGLSLAYATDTASICYVSEATVTTVGSGTCVVRAYQGGNATFASATATTAFSVTKASQQITFSTVTASNDVTFDLTATASSGLAVTLTSLTPSICAIAGFSVTVLQTGTCSAQASQAGNDAFDPAQSVTQSFSVGSGAFPSGWNFGSLNVGTSSPTVRLTFTFPAAAMIQSINVLSGGATGLDYNNAGTGSCTTGVAHNVGDSCTIDIKFTPAQPGLRKGAVVIADSTGAVAGTAYIQGNGIGPQVVVLPGTRRAISTSQFSFPSGIAVDAAGNIYIADLGHSRVIKETLTNGTYVASIIISGTLSSPTGLAIDGAGNLYIADEGNSRIVKETLVAGTYVQSLVSPNSLDGLTGVAVDQFGNVYAADTADAKVVKETPTSGGYVESLVAQGSLVFPSGVAVDAAGRVYITDDSINRVFAETPSGAGYQESSLQLSPLMSPTAVAVDAMGNLFVADDQSGRIVKETTVNGSLQEIQLTTTDCVCQGLAVDGAGNVLWTGIEPDEVVMLDLASPTTIEFAAPASGSTSYQSQEVIVQNSGNSALTFSAPPSGSNPNVSVDFPLAATSTCPQVQSNGAPFQLQSGSSCTFDVDFVPTLSQMETGTLTLSDNALNVAASTQVVNLVGGSVSATSISLVSSGSTFWVTSDDTLTASISSANGTPGGVVTFVALLDDGNQVILSDPIIDGSGNASYVGPLPGGTQSVSAKYEGDATHAGATSNIVSVHVIVPGEPLGVIHIGGQEASSGSIWDTGSVSLTVNGVTKSFPYGQFSTPEALASGLAAYYSKDGSSNVVAHASGASVRFYPRSLTATSISITNSVTYDSSHFSQASFGFN